MFSRKIILIGVLIIIFLPLAGFRAEAEDLEKGADLYWQATRSLNQKSFAESQAKFEEAAQYLSGQLKDDALRMAQFVGKMSSKITAKMLLKNDINFHIIGEVKEQDRVWHFYTTKNESLSILHLAISGQKPLNDLVSVFDKDTFTQKRVVKNRDGYLSKTLSSMPGSVSKIRMWYCDKNNTTNIAYENFPEYVLKYGGDDYIIMSEAFEKRARCSSGFSGWAFAVLGAILLAVLIWWRKSSILNLWNKIKIKKPL